MSGKKPGEEPAYRVVAADLRRRIHEGGLVPGLAMPTEPKLVEQYNVSRNTIRSALGVLQREGLIYTEHGVASFVKPTFPRRDFYLDRLSPMDEWGTGPAYDIAVDITEMPADDRTAELLDLPPGTPVLRRHTLLKVLHVPHQVAHDYYSRDIAAGTPLADPDPAVVRLGLAANLAAAGHTVTKATGWLVPRLPTVDEHELLKFIGNGAAAAVTRTLWSGERPVAVTRDIVIPGDRVEFKFSFDV